MKTKKRKIMGWTFVIPASIMIVIFNFVPMIQSFILSLKRGSGTNMIFTGFSNYKRMFQDKIFKMTLGNTFIYLILEVAIMLVMAMFLASLLNDKRMREIFEDFYLSDLRSGNHAGDGNVLSITFE